MGDFLRFRTFLMPVLIQTLFWIGIVAVVITGLVTMFSDDGGFLQGLFVLVIGPVMVRLYAELILLGFKIYEAVDEIRNRGAMG